MDEYGNGDGHRSMVKIELEVAEALAGLATTSMAAQEQHEEEEEEVKNESNSSLSSSLVAKFPSNNDSSRYLKHQEDTTNSMVKKSEKLGILNANSMEDENRLNPAFPLNCASSGRKSRQNITEAEMEARKLRRVLANRESARQTIRRRQAVLEELSRKAVDLTWENENLKKDKVAVSKQYDILRTKNEFLKAQMIKKRNIELDENREESITTNEPTISTSSTNSPFIIYNQPPFLPFVLSNPVQLGIAFPSHIPVAADSSSYEEASSNSTTRNSLYILPYPWLVTLPQSNDSNENHPRSFINLNDKPKESSECQQFFPEKVKPETPVSCKALIEHDHATNTVGDSDEIIGKIHEINANVWSGNKRLGDTDAATEARKRRKQLTRLKNVFHCRQLRIH